MNKRPTPPKKPNADPRANFTGITNRSQLSIDQVNDGKGVRNGLNVVAPTSEAQDVKILQSNHSKISSLGLRGQPYRAAFFILDNPGQLTHHIAQQCAIINVPDACRRANLYLHRVGLRLACNLPIPKVTNRYGEVTPVHEWHLVKLGGEQ